ncbi:hypothetical protein MMC12_002079 [Toensbergia leucococca]|nr:hypothetical protein [Toensbergia leucococca]
MQDDPFDSLLGLEDAFYDDGFRLGVAEGNRAGNVEGRLFGLEKGFEKYVSMGKLYGRSVVWAGRLPSSTKHHVIEEAPKKERCAIMGDDDCSKSPSILRYQAQDTYPRADHPPESTIIEGPRLPVLSKNARLEKHVRTLYALVEADSLSTQNNEDSVSEFDDRLKRAQGRIKIIEKFVGESSKGDISEGNIDRSDGLGNIEDINSPQARH